MRRPAGAAERQQLEAAALRDHPLRERERLAQLGPPAGRADRAGGRDQAGQARVLPLALVPGHLHGAVAVAGQDEPLRRERRRGEVEPGLDVEPRFGHQLPPGAADPGLAVLLAEAGAEVVAAVVAADEQVAALGQVAADPDLVWLAEVAA